MIINTHSHFSTDAHSSFFYPNFTLNELIEDMDKNHISYTITCLNPKLLSLLCPNDCSTTCPVHGKHNHLDICSPSCSHANIHWMKIFDSTTLGKLEARCLVCNEEIYKGIDPCHSYNIEFIKQCIPFKGRIFPLLYLHLANSTLNTEANFFEQNFAGQFVGYKFHPQTDMRSLDEISCFNSTLPILIHTGLRYVDNPRAALNFAKRYKGNVILAHACRLEPDVLKELKYYPNVFVDLSPACTLFSSKDYTLSPTFSSSINTAKDIYNILLNYVPIDRILFGSDVPWGNTNDELALAFSLSLSQSEKEKIMFKNAITAYQLNLT